MNMSMEMSKIEPIGEETEGTLSGFYPGTFATAVFSQRFSFSTVWISRSLENAFPTRFLSSKHRLSIAVKHHFPHEYYGLVW